MSDQVHAEFKAYWTVAEELIGKASKEQLAEIARILALQSALRPEVQPFLQV